MFRVSVPRIFETAERASEVKSLFSKVTEEVYAFITLPKNLLFV